MPYVVCNSVHVLSSVVQVPPSAVHISMCHINTTQTEDIFGEFSEIIFADVIKLQKWATKVINKKNE